MNKPSDIAKTWAKTIWADLSGLAGSHEALAEHLQRAIDEALETHPEWSAFGRELDAQVATARDAAEANWRNEVIAAREARDRADAQVRQLRQHLAQCRAKTLREAAKRFDKFLMASWAGRELRRMAEAAEREAKNA